MNEPIYGCAGCQNTAGAGGCPVHRNLNANVAYDPAPRIYDYLNHQLCNDTIQRLDKEKQQLLLQNGEMRDALHLALDWMGRAAPTPYDQAHLQQYKERVQAILSGKTLKRKCLPGEHIGPVQSGVADGFWVSKCMNCDVRI